MSDVSQTRLDHRRDLLKEKMRHRIDVIKATIRPEGAPIPLTRQHTTAEALDWWRKNRYSPAGQVAMQGWGVEKVMQLDKWLAENPDPSLSGEGAPTPQ